MDFLFLEPGWCQSSVSVFHLCDRYSWKRGLGHGTACSLLSEGSELFLPASVCAQVLGVFDLFVYLSALSLGPG